MLGRLNFFFFFRHVEIGACCRGCSMASASQLVRGVSQVLIHLALLPAGQTCTVLQQAHISQSLEDEAM